MIEFTGTQLFGLCVAMLLIGGTLTVYGIQFLEWTDRRRAARRLSSVDLPEQRDPGVAPKRYIFAADTTQFEESMRAASRELADTDSPTQRELRRAQARADAIRDSRAARRISDPPPEGMEDRVIERLHALGDDLRATETSSSNPTTEENPDGR